MFFNRINNFYIYHILVFTRGLSALRVEYYFVMVNMIFLDDIIMWSVFICEEHDLIFYCIM